MGDNELNTILEETGLSPYQADAYEALLELGSAPASEIAAVSGVPQPRIYDVLRALEDKDYAIVYERDQLYARANDPSQALSGLRTAVERYESAITEIEARYQAPAEQAGDVSLVQRFRTVFEHARENIETASEHIQLAITPDRFSNLRSALQSAHERGVHVQISLYLPDETLPFNRSAFEGVCTEVRQRDLPGPFLLLTDRQRACYAPRDRLSREYGVLVEDYTTAYIFHWYYLTRLWEVYDTIYSDHSEHPPYPFVEITDCIRGIEPALDDGATISGRVIGEFVQTGRDCDLSGQFVDVDYTGCTDETPASLVQLAAEATIYFETDDDRYSVGGRGAQTEDIAAKRFSIEQVDDTSVDIERS